MICTRRKFASVVALGAAGVGSAQAKRIAVIAHRGEHLSHAENTIPAVEAAIQIGCDFVEIDVRTTSDGAYVLMHNDTVDATTDGTGPVASLRLSQIRELHAKRGGERVPTLDEALDAMHGRCGVYFDAKRIPAAAIAAALTRHRMMDAAVVYGGFGLLKELADLGHSHLAMPEAVSAEVLRKCLAELKPRTIAFDRRDFKDDLIAMARGAGAGVFVDRLGPADDTPEGWQDAVRRGATGIQTDHPAQLKQVLASTR